MAKDREPWYGFDCDGTIACYSGDEGPTEIGEPLGIDKMDSAFNTLLAYLEQGKKCKIVTARAEFPESARAIKDWCRKYLGRELEVTNKKDFAMISLMDDRAIGIDCDTGQPWQKIRKIDTLPHWEHTKITTLPEE
jgi:hypothetical protein